MRLVIFHGGRVFHYVFVADPKKMIIYKVLDFTLKIICGGFDFDVMSRRGETQSSDVLNDMLMIECVFHQHCSAILSEHDRPFTYHWCMICSEMNTDWKGSIVVHNYSNAIEDIHSMHSAHFALSYVHDWRSFFFFY